MPPIVSFVGRSKSGKTTLLEKLIKELVVRGYKVATVKHTFHESVLDEPDKDTWRHIQAGSSATALSAANGVLFVAPSGAGTGLDTVARLFGEDYDIILTEGFKNEAGPKVEVHRREKGLPLEGLSNLVAIVTDEPLDAAVKQLSLDDVKGLADFIVDEFIKPYREKVTLFVNGELVHLAEMPAQSLKQVVFSMASVFKPGQTVRSVDLFLKREAE